MTKDTDVKTRTEYVEFRCFSMPKDAKEKAGCQCILERLEELCLYQELHQHLRGYQLTFAVPGMEKSILSSIYQEAVKYLPKFMKRLKKSKTVWYMITATQDTIEIYVELNSSYSQTKSWTQVSYRSTDGEYTEWTNWTDD